MHTQTQNTKLRVTAQTSSANPELLLIQQHKIYCISNRCVVAELVCTVNILTLQKLTTVIQMQTRKTKKIVRIYGTNDSCTLQK